MTAASVSSRRATSMTLAMVVGINAKELKL
jgi:hypothetical protein